MIKSSSQAAHLPKWALYVIFFLVLCVICFEVNKIGIYTNNKSTKSRLLKSNNSYYKTGNASFVEYTGGEIWVEFHY